VAFDLVGGRPSLDFAGTLQHRNDEPVDVLAAPADLGRWAVEAGLLESAPRVSREQLVAAARVRESIYRLYAASTAGSELPAADVRRLNSLARQTPLAISLGTDGWVHHSGTVDQLLVTLARDAIETVGGEDATLLRRCEGEGCSWIYLDRSRGGSRRWCGMGICGNRVKAAAYRRRRRED
jgi:predicted RNA-binding Zn ribbon-like protein